VGDDGVVVGGGSRRAFRVGGDGGKSVDVGVDRWSRSRRASLVRMWSMSFDLAVQDPAGAVLGRDAAARFQSRVACE
jgi:hypothetical protein